MNRIFPIVIYNMHELTSNCFFLQYLLYHFPTLILSNILIISGSTSAASKSGLRIHTPPSSADSLHQRLPVASVVYERDHPFGKDAPSPCFPLHSACRHCKIRYSTIWLLYARPRCSVPTPPTIPHPTWADSSWTLMNGSTNWNPPACRWLIPPNDARHASSASFRATPIPTTTNSAHPRLTVPVKRRHNRVIHKLIDKGLYFSRHIMKTKITLFFCQSLDIWRCPKMSTTKTAKIIAKINFWIK